MRSLLTLCLALAAAIPTQADWPQWMGENRDGNVSGTGWIKSIPAEGLKTVWRMPIKGGYAGPSVADGRVYVTDYVRTSGEAVNDPGARATLGGQERVLCFDAKTGKKIWEHAYDCPYSISYPAGPRCTPTVDGDRVYALGAEGDLLCLSTADGSVIWQRNFKKDFNSAVPIWGHAAHPLVDGDQLICMVGGETQSVVSLDKMTGKEIWKRPTVGNDIGYCPPRIIQAGGTRQLITFSPKGIESLDPKTGKPYWDVPLTPLYGMSITMPQHDGNLMFASGIGSESVMLELGSDQPTVTELWRGEQKTSIYCANSTPMIVDGVIYGSDCQVGHFAAIDTKTSDRLWTTFAPTTGGERRAKHGTAFVTKYGDQFFLFSETGDLIIAAIDSKEYNEIGRFHVLEPTGECFGRSVVWSHPAYSGKHLFARNDKEIVCVSLDADDYK
ncbi:PQQ-binding-like beta-propeller repeat protein [Rosistilla oblonga]|uniref:PQQ-binding-like beta-propeller repeat protein n=1 Tax=Rosistilla oblonga TaxID=2527990 RepID=UPI003A97A226